MKTNLNWKKKRLDDKSGYWYSAKVPIIGWEYVIDGAPYYQLNYGEKENEGYDRFVVGVFFSQMDDDCSKFTKQQFRKKETAMNACEKHLLNTAEKFNSFLNNFLN